VRAVNHPRLGVCLDFGNFKRGAELDGVRLLAPLAVHAHAKSWAFDAAGEETRLNYGETLAALKTTGFSGTIAFEYEGDGDPNKNALLARALLERSG
jgi:sugar phosphate isomerase/epimerase